MRNTEQNSDFAGVSLEARAGIEPANKGFADLASTGVTLTESTANHMREPHLPRVCPPVCSELHRKHSSTTGVV
jgi:hypothetical protein